MACALIIVTRGVTECRNCCQLAPGGKSGQIAVSQNILDLAVD
jgi:hypothetical protein